MATIGINHINIRASEDLITELRDFYCAVLHLQQGPRPNFRSKGFWLYSGKNALIHLTIARANESRLAHVTSTLDHVAFNCDNFPMMSAKLTEMGIPFELDEVPDTPIRQIFFHDPAGNGVELTFNGN